MFCVYTLCTHCVHCAHMCAHMYTLVHMCVCITHTLCTLCVHFTHICTLIYRRVGLLFFTCFDDSLAPPPRSWGGCTGPDPSRPHPPTPPPKLVGEVWGMEMQNPRFTCVHCVYTCVHTCCVCTLCMCLCCLRCAPK